MNCHNTKALLIRFMEGDVSEKVGLEIEQHLKSCRACRMEKAQLDKSWDLLDRYETPKVSHDFTSSLMRRIRCEQAPMGVKEIESGPPQWRFAWRLASALAASIIVAIAFGIFWKQRSLEQDAGKVGPSHVKEAVRSVTDEEIIQNLEIYENMDLLQNLELLSDLDVVENLEESNL